VRFKDGTINPDICAALLMGLTIADQVYRDLAKRNAEVNLLEPNLALK